MNNIYMSFTSVHQQTIFFVKHGNICIRACEVHTTNGGMQFSFDQVWRLYMSGDMGLDSGPRSARNTEQSQCLIKGLY